MRLSSEFSRLLSQYRYNYGFWFNKLVLHDAQPYSVSQLDMDPYDSISHIFIATLSTVTSFQYPQQYTSIDFHPQICIYEHFSTRYCSYNSCNTLPIRCFRFAPPGTTFVQMSAGFSTDGTFPIRLYFIAKDSLIAW